MARDLFSVPFFTWDHFTYTSYYRVSPFSRLYIPKYFLPSRCQFPVAVRWPCRAVPQPGGASEEKPKRSQSQSRGPSDCHHINSDWSRLAWFTSAACQVGVKDVDSYIPIKTWRRLYTGISWIVFSGHSAQQYSVYSLIHLGPETGSIVNI